MGKQKDQEGSGKGIYRMFSIIMSLTDFGRVALERVDWPLIERGYDLRLYVSCCSPTHQ